MKSQRLLLASHTPDGGFRTSSAGIGQTPRQTAHPTKNPTEQVRPAGFRLARGSQRKEPAFSPTPLAYVPAALEMLSRALLTIAQAGSSSLTLFIGATPTAVRILSSISRASSGRSLKNSRALSLP